MAPSSYPLKILVRGRGEVSHTAALARATVCGESRTIEVKFEG